MSHKKGRGLSKRRRTGPQCSGNTIAEHLWRPKSKMGSRGKHWCFTWNNYSEEVWDICKRNSCSPPSFHHLGRCVAKSTAVGSLHSVISIRQNVPEGYSVISM